MRHRRHSTAVQTGLLAFRATRRVLLLCVLPALLVLAVWLCFASPPISRVGCWCSGPPYRTTASAARPPSPLSVESAGHGHRQGRG
ncbi:hypothetical protein [Streptomyces sp. NPDC094472]|uniref:hypothetical protein n=1 Tax=Streptomyces sp. NPDC094472 TaxID=3155080 RepID=UPI00331B3155